MSQSYPNIFLICGYKRTGKDSLYQLLSGLSPNKWTGHAVYRHPDSQPWVQSYTKNMKYTRKAFADELKSEVSEIYYIPRGIPDEEKEYKQFIHYQTGDMVSARDIYIEWGTIRRAENPDYWCSKVLSTMKEDEVTTITDWRFYNELKIMQNSQWKTKTIRVFRRDVIIPNISLQSEHELDNYKTDYLIIPQEQFKAAVKQFPQYSIYIQDAIL